MAETIQGSPSQPAVAAVPSASVSKDSVITMNVQGLTNPTSEQWVVIGTAASAPATLAGYDGASAGISKTRPGDLDTVNGRGGATPSFTGTKILASGIPSGVAGHHVFLGLVHKTTALVDADVPTPLADLGASVA